MLIRSLTRLVPLALISVLVTACNFGGPATLPGPPEVTPKGQSSPAPTATRRPVKPLDTPTPTPAPEVSFAGVSFFFEPALGTIEGSGIGMDDPGEVGSPDWVLPARAAFVVTGYPLPRSAIVPQIAVFSVAALKKANPSAAARVEQLEQILADKPDLTTLTGRLPQLSDLTQDEMFHAHLKYLDFKNGSGLRFIIQVASDIRPISNEDLSYMFQGITSDGQYYVAVIMPLSQADLPGSENSLTNAEAAALLDDFEKYLTDTSVMLEAVDDASFKPGLDLLDKTMASINVASSEFANLTPMPTPTDGPVSEFDDVGSTDDDEPTPQP